MIKYKTQTPYIASHMILRQEDKMAFVMRSNTKWMNGYYDLPSGKVEDGESYLSAGCRELLEEAGVRARQTDLRVCHVMHRCEETTWVDVYFEVLNYEGEPYNAEPEVHAELAWLDPKNLPENVVPSVKFALEQIEAGEIYSEYGWPVAAS